MCQCCKNSFKERTKPLCSFCAREGVSPCDQCERFYFPSDLEVDLDTGNTYCEECKTGDRSVTVCHNDVGMCLYSALISKTGIRIVLCPCGEPFFFDNGIDDHFIASNIKRYYTRYLESSISSTITNALEKLATSLCWNCQKKGAKEIFESVRCNTCLHLHAQDTVMRCDQNCCWQCPWCRVQCDICEKPQCHKTKECNMPSSGKKRRSEGRYCDKCKTQKLICYNSYSQPVNEDSCPHPWCLKCEKHELKEDRMMLDWRRHSDCHLDF